MLLIGDVSRYASPNHQADDDRRSISRTLLKLISRQARLPTKAMLVWLGTYIRNWLSIWLAIFLCLVVTFRPRFHSDHLTPSATALSKRFTMVQMFLLNCLPPPICVLKHVRTRLIILTGGKNNHKIKIAETGQLAVGSRHSPLGLQIYFLSFPKY